MEKDGAKLDQKARGQLSALQDTILDPQASPEVRKSAIATYRALTGKADTQNRFTLVPGGQAIDPTTNATYTLPSTVIYVIVTALSLPGAAIMSLVAGALFGVVTGTIIVSFASSIGATLAFLSARFLLRDWVQTKFGERLKAIDDGIARDGAMYLFTIRLIIGTGKYKTNEAMVEAFERSGAEMITVAVRRVNITDRSQPSLLDFIDLKKIV